MFEAILGGLIMGGGLIIAVGAQNSFLLEQSLKQHFSLIIAILFILSDAVAISSGALGMGLLIKQHSMLLEISRYAGVAFLLYFAISRIRTSFKEESLLLAHTNKCLPFLALMSTALAVTWLNPHFYLDTMIIMGSIANQWSQNSFWFVLGGILASIIWFLGLRFIGKSLSPLLKSPVFWRWFNRINGIMVFAIAIKIFVMPL